VLTMIALRLAKKKGPCHIWFSYVLTRIRFNSWKK
jgi:hypothetical protein